MILNQKHKILVVEDNTPTRDLYIEILKREGFIVDAASDGEEGLLKCREGGYSVILLDVMLPKLDGLGLLSELNKKPPDKPNGPIIILSNLARDKVINETKQLGAAYHLIKSDITPGELVVMIKKVIKT